MTKSDAPKTVHLYPTARSFIPGVPAIEQDVDPKRAKELLSYQPPAFTVDPAEAATGPVQTYHVPSGGDPADQSSGPAGPSDDEQKES